MKNKKSENKKEAKNINSLDHVFNQFTVLKIFIRKEKCELDAKYELSETILHEINYRKQYNVDDKVILQELIEKIKDIITRRELDVAGYTKWKEVEEFVNEEIEIGSEWSTYSDYDIEFSRQMIVTAKQFLNILEEGIKRCQ